MVEQTSYGLVDFAEEFEAVVGSESDYFGLLEKGQVVLRKLLPNREFVKDVLAQAISAEMLPE